MEMITALNIYLHKFQRKDIRSRRVVNVQIVKILCKLYKSEGNNYKLTSKVPINCILYKLGMSGVKFRLSKSAWSNAFDFFKNSNK